MGAGDPIRNERRAKVRQATRTTILEAARKLAEREGARNLSLRGVAAESGYAPAALYGYFASKDELLLALAADDLASLARTMRSGKSQGLAKTIGAALAQLQRMETMAAACAALTTGRSSSEHERHFNGRLIAALTALSDASGRRTQSREEQCDVMLLAATLTGLAMLSRTGRLDALGFAAEELLRGLEARFSKN